MSTLLRLSELDRQKWGDLLTASPAATFFHTFEWAQLWEESHSFFKSYFLVDIAADGNYQAGLPFVKARKLLTGYYSMPMGAYGGALGGNELELYQNWLGVTKKKSRERLVVSSLHKIPALLDLGFREVERFTRIAEGVETGRLEAAWSAKTKNEFKYALASGLSVRPAQNAGDARRCFDLAQKKRSKGFYTAEFYQNMLEFLSPRQLCWLLAWRDDELAGFQIYLVFQGDWFYWDAGYDPRSAKSRPGYLLFHHALQKARKQGGRRFNLGATPQDAPGVVFFKSRLGGKKAPVYEYLLDSPLTRRLRAAYEKIRSRI